MCLYRVNLHLHTTLSPCADILMTPGNIIKTALENNIDVLAITDHNSAENVKVTIKLAENTPLIIIPGMEVETVEEVHLLCLFDRLEQVLALQSTVYKNLPDLKNNEEYFGHQLITGIDDTFISRISRLLVTATSLNVNQVVNSVRQIGGIVIPSHINRSYGLITNLGFVPPELNLSVLEIANDSVPEIIKAEYPFLQKYTLIKNSDAHYLEDMCSDILEIYLEEVTVEKIFEALRKEM